jgi:prepilin-type N-terminal cleavage/methylation domain-containing protein
MQQIIKNKNAGFTLVEVLVAISIFSISIIGILSVLASNITDTNYAKNKMTAEYLAQEGIEYIRNMRDTFVLYDPTNPSMGWEKFNNAKLTSFAASCQPNAQYTGCSLGDLPSSSYNYPSQQPMIDLSLNRCEGSCTPLLYDKATGGYVSTSSGTTVSSIFTREITVATSYSGNPDETQITSTVYWSQGSGTYNISFSEVLYNWVQ